MKRARTNRYWFSALTALVVTVAIITVGATEWPTHSTSANGVDCSGAWYESKDPVVRDICSRQKAANMLQPAQELATAAAQPYYQTVPGFKPVVLLPPPDYAKEIRELKFDDPYAGAPPVQWRTANSVWKDGAVPNSSYTSWDELFVVTRLSNKDSATTKAYPILETEVSASLGDGTDARYQKRWVCPRAVGEIYITNITNPDVQITDVSTPYPGLQSIVDFKTKTGQTGNFNMATEAWTFDP